jgi:uncharacterized integral membrane protein
MRILLAFVVGVVVGGFVGWRIQIRGQALQEELRRRRRAT